MEKNYKIPHKKQEIIINCIPKFDESQDETLTNLLYF